MVQNTVTHTMLIIQIVQQLQNHFLDCPRSSCSPWFPFGVRFELLFGPLYLNWETLNAISFNVNLITLETLDLVSGSQHQSNRKRDRPDPRVRFKNPFAYINTPSRASLRYECHISVNAAYYHSIYVRH